MSSPGRRKPRDLNLLALAVVEEATAEPDEDHDDGKDPAAVALGLKGGKARAAKLTPDERRRIARKAAEARWSKVPAAPNPMGVARGANKA